MDNSQLKFPIILFQFLDSFFESRTLGNYTLDNLLSDIGISENNFRDPQYFLNGNQYSFMLKLLENNLIQEPPAICVLRHVSINHMGLGGIAGMTAFSLKESLDTVLEFHKLIMPMIEMTLDEDTNNYNVIASMSSDFDQHNPLIIEFCLGAMKQFSDEVTGKNLPYSLEFSHSPIWGMDTNETIALYKAYFNCDVKFNCSRSALIGNADMIRNQHLTQPNRILHDSTKNILKNQLNRLNTQISLTTKAKKHLEGAAAIDKYPDLNDLADELNMSPRSLSRKLAKENIQFKSLSNEVRFNKAKTLLITSDLPLNRLAMRVGYSKSETFVRAFKVHTGMTPNQWKLMSEDRQWKLMSEKRA